MKASIAVHFKAIDALRPAFRDEEGLSRWHRRRREWLSVQKCAGCQSTEELKVEYAGSSFKLWSMSISEMERVLSRCCVLCRVCRLSLAAEHRLKITGERLKPVSVEERLRKAGWIEEKRGNKVYWGHVKLSPHWAVTVREAMKLAA